MKSYLITVGGVLTALVLFFVIAPIGCVMALSRPAPTPEHTVLYLDLRGGLTDQASSDPLSILTGGRQSVTDIALRLRAAGEDRKVKGLFVRLPEGGMSPAAADELAQAFRRFRADGKKIIAHSQGLHAQGAVVSTYTLGAAADELWMQPGASFETVGLTSEEIFLARFFQRFGIAAEFEQREDFKSAVNAYLYPDYTPQHREAQTSWMTAVLDASISSISADRKLSSETVRAAIEGGPYDAAGALERKLIDKLGQVDEARTAALDAAGTSSVLLDLREYIPPRRGAGPLIAVINVEGALMTGASGSDPLNGAIAGSDDIDAAIRDAVDDDAIKAIVLRVSSPGGSDIASEQIAAAVRAAKAARKPVVVSMGAYAASGGYWISAEADKIIAQPTTITGSIGVYGGKFSGGEGAARYGVDLKSITVGGEYASVGAMGQRFTPAQRAAYAAQVDRIYALFIANVARGRRMPEDRVRAVAGGRVWTGVQALRLGLVDGLGGLTEAVEEAKKLANIKGEARLVMSPAPGGVVESLQRLLGVRAEEARALSAAGALMDDPRVEALIEEAAAERLRTRGANAMVSDRVNWR